MFGTWGLRRHNRDLKSADWSVREAAAKALGRLGDTRSTRTLLGVLGDSDARVRAAAAQALGWLGDRTAANGLIEALGDPESEVRRSAAQALNELGLTKWQDWVNGDDEDFSRLGSSHETQAARPLLKALDNPRWDLRSAAIRALGELGDNQATDTLVQALQGAEGCAHVRESAAFALAKIASPKAVPALLKALADPESNVRWAAARALGDFGDPQAVDALVPMLNGAETHAYVREAAAFALGKIGERDAVMPLIAALEDPHPNVRWAAAWAVGEIADLRAVDALIIALDDPDEGVSAYAAVALGNIGDAHAEESLAEALCHPEAVVREAAADALMKIRGTWPAVSAAHESPDDTHYGLGQYQPERSATISRSSSGSSPVAHILDAATKAIQELCATDHPIVSSDDLQASIRSAVVDAVSRLFAQERQLAHCPAYA